MSLNVLRSAALTLPIFLLACGLCKADVPPVAGIRGCNYYPAHYAWAGGAMWTRCPTSVYETDCAVMSKLGINMVRTFIPVIRTPDQKWQGGDGSATDAMLGRLDAFLSACRKNGIRAILCFDGMDQVPVGADGKPDYAMQKAWIGSILRRFRDDSRILAWDVANEPDAPNPNDPWSDKHRDYVVTMFQYEKTIATQPLTVGMAWRLDELKAAGIEPDIVQYHEYGGRPASEIVAGFAMRRALFPGKPLLVGEFGLSSAKDRRLEQQRIYENVLSAAQADGKVWGLSFWCLNDFPNVREPEGAYGILDPLGNEKEAAQTVRWYFGAFPKFQPVAASVAAARNPDTITLDFGSVRQVSLIRARIAKSVEAHNITFSVEAREDVNGEYKTVVKSNSFLFCPANGDEVSIPILPVASRSIRIAFEPGQAPDGLGLEVGAYERANSGSRAVAAAWSR